MENKIKIAISFLVGFSTPMVALAQQTTETVSAPRVRQSETQMKMAKLEKEFTAVSSKLSEIEAQAMEQEQVAAAKHRFQETLEEVVMEENPDLEDAFRKRGKYAEYIERARKGAELPDDVDISEVYTKYNAAHQKVLPAEQAAMRKQAVQEAFKRYQQSLLTQMKSVDQDVMDYLERKQEIREEYSQLASEAQD